MTGSNGVTQHQFTTSFDPAFFAPLAEQLGAASENMAVVRISYCKTKYDDYAAFCRSADFELFKKQYEESLLFLVNFCWQHKMAAAEKIADNFNTFYKHRFDEENYFDTHAQYVDGMGKRALDYFCDLVRDERIDVETKKTDIEALSKNVVFCAAGAASSLRRAAEELSKAVGGIFKAKLWTQKEKCIAGLAQEECNKQFSGILENYIGDEIHYVNAVLNYVAKDFGFTEIEDNMAPSGLDLEFLNVCKERIFAKLTPDRIVLPIAQECLQYFRNLVGSGRKRCTAKLMATCSDVLTEISDGQGLPAGTLNLYHFMKLEEDERHITVRTDATLIATDVLRAMVELNLLQDRPMSRGYWQEDEGARDPSWLSLLTYGESLAWIIKGRSLADVSEPTWHDACCERELPTLTDLKHWIMVQPSTTDTPPLVAIRQAVCVSDVNELSRIRIKWLLEADTAIILLKRLGPDRAETYLKENLLYFRDEFPRRERAALLNDIVSMVPMTMAPMRIWPTAMELIRVWYADLLEFLSEPYGQGKKSRLQYWMSENNHRAMNSINFALARHPSDIKLVNNQFESGARIYSVLQGYQSLPMLHEAMQKGHSAAIDAWHQLVIRPECLSRLIQEQWLLPLLAAKNRKGKPGLLAALRYQNNIAVIKPCVALLTDLRIVANIGGELLSLLAAKDNKGVPALWYTDPRKFSQLLIPLLQHQIVSSFIRDGLLDLVAARNQAGTPVLAFALEAGNFVFVQDYTDLLLDLVKEDAANTARDPDSPPFIVNELWSLLAATDSKHIPACWFLLRKGNPKAFNDYQNLLTVREFAGYIKKKLLILFAAEDDKKYTPGIWLAVLAGHVEIIGDYGSSLEFLLRNPTFTKEAQKILPQLLAVQKWPEIASTIMSQDNKLTDRQIEAFKVFFAVFERPIIFPYISAALLAQSGVSDSSPQGILAKWKNMIADYG